MDVSDYALPGKNQIVVSVDNRRWEGWWYEGAGIYRPARLRVQPAVHFARKATFVKPRLASQSWVIDLSTVVSNAAGQSVPFEINARFLDEEGHVAASAHAAGVTAPGQAEDRPVRFIIEAGRLLGVGNGDPNGVYPEHGEVIPTFSGRCQAIVGPDEAGRISVRVQAEGLPEVRFER